LIKWLKIANFDYHFKLNIMANNIQYEIQQIKSLFPKLETSDFLNEKLVKLLPNGDFQIKKIKN
jgi:hypothetical protein